MSLSRLAVEITNRCNLDCAHCLREQSEQPRDFSVGLLNKILRQARDHYGVSSITLTGGEPLMHPQLEQVLEAIVAHDFKFSMVTNGTLALKRMALFRRPEIKASIGHVAVSLDGPDESTHDHIRGEGAYRKSMAAIMALKTEGISLGLKYTIGAHNLDSLETAVLGMIHLEPSFVECSHMMPTPDNLEAGLVASPSQWREAEAVIGRLAHEFKTSIAMNAGIYSEQTFFACASLMMIELYVDVAGRLCFCCVLPGLRGSDGDPDSREVVADLCKVDLWEAHQKLVGVIAGFQRARINAIGGGALGETDHFQCMSCARYFKKVEWLEEHADNPWSRAAGTKETPDEKTS